MRISTLEANTLKKIIQDFDPDANIYLFGSRTRDDLKGGDIDLLVMSSKIGIEEKIKLKLKLYDALGEQKIDIVVPDETNNAFVQLAINEGILL